MKFFSEILKKSEEYNLIEENIRQDATPLAVSGLTESSKAHLATSLCKNLDVNGVIVCQSDYDAQKMYDDISFFCGEQAIYYPSKEMQYYKTLAKSNEYINQRLSALEKLLSAKEKTIFILSINALLQFSVDYDSYLNNMFTLKVGDEIKINILSERLVKLGYTHEDSVEGKGQFSVRGGIVDFFAPNAENPSRIEFFGDEIDSIREFDAIEQTSIENIESVTITAAAEGFSGAEEKTSVISYFSPDTIVFFNEPMKISQSAENFQFEIEETVKALIEKEVIKEAEESYIFDYSDTVKKLSAFKLVALLSLSQSVKDFKVRNNFNITVGVTNTYVGLNDYFWEDLNQWLYKKYSIFLPISSKSKIDKITETIKEHGLSPIIFDGKLQDGEKNIYIIKGYLKKGFYYPSLKLCVVSDEELFGKSTKRKRSFIKSDQASKIRSFTDLKPGDYIVHKVHGIGKYVGLNTLLVDGFNKDYLKIEYSGDDFLYVPCDSFDLIQKYIGKEGHVRLNKMGGSDFAKQKLKVKQSTKELAEELIKIYSARKYQKGYAFSPDTSWQAEFEARFPYEETEDQLKSIEEVKNDMESERPMDRLLCGDVGYGKTEVALRAAFKAAMDSKQVAYLAPTTVLVMQHFNTFLSRMKDYPIRIEMLSRFKTQKEQKKILKELESGEIDIIIGTHRLLGNDIKFHDLGLLIVDEEQRFGVKHKERIKEIKHNVDVLTLTATPIPRTLQMSMVNIKDMSTLYNPPEDRYPVSTFVTEYNQAIVIDAIKKELARRGQVYYLCNRISSVSTKARHLKEALPDAKIRYAHGQMDEAELEEIMISLSEGEVDILVCTTIIETGLDIPNVNTIIIEDADRLGLSQLYQLRGRVGRANRRAFAYLTYKKDKMLNEDAVKRLSAIKEFTEFGSGFKIAMRDLEIRGAGNLLGAEQHGHINNIGYDMYCKILAESVAELSGIEEKEEEQITVDIPVEAFIPPAYIKNHSARLDIYKKIAAIGSENDKMTVFDEMVDRFGTPPKSVEKLIDVSYIKVLCAKSGVSEVCFKNDRLIFYLKEIGSFETVSLLISMYKGRILLSAGQRPYFSLNMNREEKADMAETVKSLLQSFKDLHTDKN